MANPSDQRPLPVLYEEAVKADYPLKKRRRTESLDASVREAAQTLEATYVGTKQIAGRSETPSNTYPQNLKEARQSMAPHQATSMRERL